MRQEYHVHAWGASYEDALARFNAEVEDRQRRGWRLEGEMSIVAVPHAYPTKVSPAGYTLSQGMVRGRDGMRLILLESVMGSSLRRDGGARSTLLVHVLTDLPLLDFVGVYGEMLAGFGDSMLRYFKILNAVEVGDPTVAQIRAMDTPHFSAGVMLREQGIDYITLSDFADMLQEEQKRDSG